MRISLLPFFLLCFILNLGAQGVPCQELSSSAYFSFDQCVASQSYEEFTAQITAVDDCSPISIVGGNLYRDNPNTNIHSCTQGESNLGMCVSIDDNCSFDPISDKAVKVDVLITPAGGSSASLSGISFFEQSSPTYLWQYGQTGLNDYPTKYSITVSVNGTNVFSNTDIATNLTWTEQSIDFSSLPSFTVNTPTVFNIELLAYCPVGNGANVSVWDIDELSIDAACSSASDGGILTGGPFGFCVGDGVADFIDSAELVLSGNSGENGQWIITDINGNILGLPTHFSEVDFDGAPAGTCLVWHLSYDGTVDGLEVGENTSGLSGCFALSNSVEVLRSSVSGGTLLGGPFTFCVGDGVSDMIAENQITLSGNTGTNSQWVVTDDQGNILGLPASFAEVDFDGSGFGTCLIWHLSFEEGLQGAEVGSNASDLVGCYSLSNSIEVQRNGPQGGVLEGGPFTFCVEDGFADFINPGDVVLSGNLGTNSQWLVTDDQGNILGLPPMLSAVNFEDAEVGTCQIWHLSYEGVITGAEVGNNVSELEGCFDLSNSVAVNRTQTEAAILEGGPFVFCVGDVLGDFIDSTDIIINGGTGPNTQWVVTNQQGEILGLPPHFSAVDFDNAGTGICLLWVVNYEGVLNGAEIGNNASLLSGCFALSNAIPIIRNETSGGVLEGGAFSFCVGNGEADSIDSTEIILTGNIGTNSQWVVTDENGIIIGLSGSISEINFDEAAPGICKLWHLSYENGLQGAVIGNNVSELLGCFSFSNALEVIKIQPEGGVLEGGPFAFCVGDDEADFIGASEIVLSGNTGTNSQWVITDANGIILGLPGSFADVDFDGAEDGVCLIWHLSYENGLIGAEEGLNAMDIEGCFNLSNPIEVERSDDCGFVNCPEEENLMLWGILESDLLMMDINTGKLLKRIPLITNFSPDFIGLTWDEEQDIFYVVAERLTNPTLATIDRYTGIVTAVGEIDQVQPQAMELTIVESLEYNPDNGILFASGGNNPSNNNFSSSFLFQLDKNNGNAIRLGSFEGSCQDEADVIMYASSVWYYLDGCPDPQDFGTINLANADQSFIRNITEISGGRMDADPFTDQIYIADALSRILYTLDTDGNSTEVGEMYPSGLFDAVLRDIDFAPYLSNDYYGGVLASDVIVFCVDDGEDDFVEDDSIQLFGNSGTSDQWVVTDDQGNILGLPSNYSDVNFEGAEAGTCLIWNVSYSGPVENLEDGQNVFELEGCFGLSNPIQVIREAGADCGNLVLGDSSLKVFPNPSSQFITILNDIMDADYATIEIYNSGGRLVESISRFRMIDQVPIDISHLTSGVYSVRMIHGQKIASKRFVVAR